MTKAEKLLEIYRRLFALYGECGCPLKHESAFQLLAAVMLSAQCRDDRVNEVTAELFAVAPDAQSMAKLPPAEIERIIHPCGLSVAKAKNLHASAQKLLTDLAGNVPDDMDSLVALPGIGRKSANVILGNWFGIPGFPVDTHVNRLLNRLGVASSQDPEKIEREVTDRIAPEYWTNFSHLLIQHGRRVCIARREKCSECKLQDICRYGKEKK